MRVVFLGTPQPAVPSLRALLEAPDVEVAGVVTNPDRPAGRGYALRPSPVKVVAQDAGVPVWQPDRARDVLPQLAAVRPDACAVVAYGKILPQDVLDAGGRGFVNLHFSLLPAWRGAAPVTAALLAGDEVTGVTCFVLEAGMDTGPVLRALRTDVRPGETAGELTARLAEAGAPLLVASVRGFVDGSVTPVPQDHARATLAPKVAPEDARLDWTAPADVLERAVRAYNPVPGAHTALGGTRLKVHRASVPRHEPGPDDDGTRVADPGTIVVLDDGRPVVACGTARLRLDEVQPAGKPRMDGAAFARGRALVGERLG